MSFFFFFNDTATTEIYTLSLHDALPICPPIESEKIVLVDPFEIEQQRQRAADADVGKHRTAGVDLGGRRIIRSEEHTSELQSPDHVVCRLLLEKKKKVMSQKDLQNLASH